MTNKLPMQVVKFIAAGLTQLLLDWSVFSIAYYLTGQTVAPNLLGRVSGACLGFWLNGKYTFSDGNSARLGKSRFAKFLVIWLALTAISTAALYWTEHKLSSANIYIAKVFIEAVLAAISFTASRFWVYR